MSDYIVHGKKGNGKSLVMVGRIRDALLAGKRVATNLNLNLEKMLPRGMRNVQCIRLPDHPTIDDLKMIGIGSKNVDESTYGLVVLDECASMLNSRQFGDKGRAPLLDWFVHSRKLGWDTYFICQNPAQIDKQIRESLVELSVSCKRLDKVRIPFLGVISKRLFGVEIRLPKIHRAVVRYGLERDSLVNDVWTYRGHGLYDCYDTRQVFAGTDSDGSLSYLSPWHTKGRYEDAPVSQLDKVKLFVRLLCLGDLRAPGVSRDKLPLVALLAKLPIDERMRHYKRFQLAGAV